MYLKTMIVETLSITADSRARNVPSLRRETRGCGWNWKNYNERRICLSRLYLAHCTRRKVRIAMREGAVYPDCIWYIVQEERQELQWEKHLFIQTVSGTLYKKKVKNCRERRVCLSRLYLVYCTRRKVRITRREESVYPDCIRHIVKEER